MHVPSAWPRATAFLPLGLSHPHTDPIGSQAQSSHPVRTPLQFGACLVGFGGPRAGAVMGPKG